MAELDTINLRNPFHEDFTVNFNGEPYAIKHGETKTYPKFLAFHIAKHLSNRILGEEVIKLKAIKSDNPYRPEVAQLMIYDNPSRRIALYDILGSKERVEECIKTMNLKGFIGEMHIYDASVERKERRTKEATSQGTEKTTK